MRSQTLMLRFGVVLGLVALGCAAAILYPVVIAKSLISEVRTIERHPISEAWLRQWAEEHGGDYSCDDSRCRAVVEVYNSFLSTLRLARTASFTAAVTLEEGRLARVYMLLIDLDYGADPVGASTWTGVDYTSVREPGYPPSSPEVSQEPTGKPPGVGYRVASSAEPHDLALAYKINVWCLARSGRCADSEQAPEIWALRRPDGHYEK